MPKIFNTTGSCNPNRHYMVDLTSRLKQIKRMVDNGDYFAINRGRQYGKTTTLKAMARMLMGEYTVVSLDFQALSSSDYLNEENFIFAFIRELLMLPDVLPPNIRSEMNRMQDRKGTGVVYGDLFGILRIWCAESENPVVLMIDEVDTASNNQVFLDFLNQLRRYYLNRDNVPTFHSVILAGVHDIRNLRQKIRPDAEHKHNSPWNIAVNFDVDMSFSPADIAGMLREYENDWHTGMDIAEISQLIYDYTSGYPVLVSSFCKLMDEKIPKTEEFPTKSDAWTREGFLRAEKILENESMPLIETLINKLEDSEPLRRLIYETLFSGKPFVFNRDNAVIGSAIMYGFLKNQGGMLAIANRIFEVRLYNWFVSLEMTDSEMFDIGASEKNQFIHGGKLDMALVIEKFAEYYADIYGDQPEKFKEENGRRMFLMYLRPIINGTGQFYVEAQTRNQKRTDIVVNYAGEEFVIELKIWRGPQYHTDGEEQLLEYLDFLHLKTGYLVTFNFNQRKATGIERRQYDDKTLVEVTV